jgi:hypothetical protein
MLGALQHCLVELIEWQRLMIAIDADSKRW